MKSVELFTGAGGLALGLAKVGFSHELLIERDQYACDTIRENKERQHPVVRDWHLVQDDVVGFDYSPLSQDIGVVAGGPPCQPFSLGGKHRAHNDKRDMFPEAVRAVRELRPLAFVFENVKGLTRHSFSSYFNYIYLRLTYPELTRKANEEWQAHLARLEKCHTQGQRKGLVYNVVHRVLNAADFGIPQKRERVFIVGVRDDLGREWSFPDQTHSLDKLLYDQWVTGEYWDIHKVAKRQRPKQPPRCVGRVERLAADGPPDTQAWRTVRDALADLPEPSEKGSEKHLNHKLVPGARSYEGHTGSPLDFPAKALKAGVHGVPGGENMITFKNGRVRYFTVREAARIQTFPDDYLFHGSWTETMRQLGNAVPVDLASAVAGGLHDLLKRCSAA